MQRTYSMAVASALAVTLMNHSYASDEPKVKAAAGVQRPNVLFILSDDQRYDTISALGAPYIKTPNLDALASQGCVFTRNFCTTPICTPARAEILTGRNSFRNGVVWFGIPIAKEHTLLPQAFRDSGYHTIHIGKWHNDGHPRDKGYDRVRQVFLKDNLNDYSKNGQWMRFNEASGTVEGHSTELFTGAALDEINTAPTDKPWFCFLSYHAPHDPHDTPAPFDTMYDPMLMPLFPNFMPEHPIDNGTMTLRDELLENWPRRQDAMRRYRARYYSAISHMDNAIGRLVAQLRTNGKMANTIIVFTGDQGLAAGSHGLLGKENMYDHSIASPLIFFGKGIPSGGKFEVMSHHTDLFPTLCELTSVPKPATATDGFSLVPVMNGKQLRVRDAVLTEFCIPLKKGGPWLHEQRAIRTERWKLVWNRPAKQYQLFDLQRDADEMVNLLATWRTQLRAEQATANKDPNWGKSRWAGSDFRPVYTEAEIKGTAKQLWEKMIAMMAEQGDIITPEQMPPCP